MVDITMMPHYETNCMPSEYGRDKPHEFGPWEDYSEGGITIMTSGPRIGKTVNFWSDRQHRTCQRCGRREDRIVKQEIL